VTPIIRTVQDHMRSTDRDRIVKILSEGGIVILAVDTVYGLITEAFNHKAFECLNQIKAERRLPYSIIFDSVSSLEKWYGELDLLQQNIIRTLLPGPVTCILPSNQNVPTGFGHRNEGIGVRVSSDPVITYIIQELGSPIWASSANRSGEPAPINFTEIKHSILQSVDMAIDRGPTQLQQESTVVDIRQKPFNIKRRGPWLNRVERVLQQSEEPFDVLIVCTGNICRSPIAAALLQQQVGPVDRSGISVTSAGVGALEGNPASQEMVVIGKEWGVDLTQHSACQVNQTIVDEADLILVMSWEYRNYLLEFDDHINEKIRLLGEFVGRDNISDPYQLSEDNYRHAANIIQEAAKSWAVELSRLIPSSSNSQIKPDSDRVEA